MAIIKSIVYLLSIYNGKKHFLPLILAFKKAADTTINYFTGYQKD